MGKRNDFGVPVEDDGTTTAGPLLRAFARWLGETGRLTNKLSEEGAHDLVMEFLDGVRTKRKGAKDR